MRNKPSVFAVVGTLAALFILMQASRAYAQDTYKILHPFDWAALPSGALTLDAKGDLYGTTEQGGQDNKANCSRGCGTVYELVPGTDGVWTTKFLYIFPGGRDGYDPNGGMIFDKAGNLYGTTASWALFELAANTNGSWTYSVIPGCAARGLTLDSPGNLYGSGCNSVFRLAPHADGSWTETTLHSFSDAAKGKTPNGELIFDQAGNLYGTTAIGGDLSGGTLGCGVVFELSPGSGDSWTETVLYTFVCSTDGGETDGAYPNAGLAIDSVGNLYGTTAQGGDRHCGYANAGCGIAFKLAPNPGGAWKETVLHRFTGGWDGAGPQGPLVLDKVGNLYGTSEIGGATGFGAVYELSMSSGGNWTENVLHSFLGYAIGTLAPVIFDPSGNLYGTAYEGGIDNHGLVFEITP